MDCHAQSFFNSPRPQEAFDPRLFIIGFLYIHLQSDGTRSLLASDRKIKERNKEAKAAERKSEKREKDKKSSSGN